MSYGGQTEDAKVYLLSHRLVQNEQPQERICISKASKEKKTRDKTRQDKTRAHQYRSRIGGEGTTYNMKNLYKRRRVEDDKFDYIFTIPQEHIYAKVKNQNLFYLPRAATILMHLTDKTKYLYIPQWLWTYNSKMQKLPQSDKRDDEKMNANEILKVTLPTIPRL